MQQLFFLLYNVGNMAHNQPESLVLVILSHPEWVVFFPLPKHIFSRSGLKTMATKQSRKYGSLLLAHFALLPWQWVINNGDSQWGWIVLYREVCLIRRSNNSRGFGMSMTMDFNRFNHFWFSNWLDCMCIWSENTTPLIFSLFRRLPQLSELWLVMEGAWFNMYRK
jgi:hypothetical protein